jgi:N-dimethylarginine dimethylaminohydrolase
MRKHANRNLKESDPEMWEKMAMESNALAAAYRKHGVKVIRNESGSTPQELVDYTLSWSRQRQMTLFGQSAGETFGHVYLAMMEVSNSYAQDLTHREAMVEVMKNDPEAVMASMPALVPTADFPQTGPYTGPGDPVIFDKKVLIGIGVSDPSHINDFKKPRSSGNEFGAEMLRRLLRPFGWSVEVVYFNSNYTYHIDCLMAPLEEGLLAKPAAKDAFWTPLPAWLNDWEVIETTLEDHQLGCHNNEPLGNKGLVLPAGTKKFSKDLEKRGWELEEVPYSNIWNVTGSGIHCSTAAIWRES